jgi:hypothetical protein
MGRGRAKAKQTKVARELKYSSPTTDFDTLQRELSGGTNGTPRMPLPEDDGVPSRWDDEIDDWKR